MKFDKSGCSTCARGSEKYENFYSSTLKKNLIQYDYRSDDGELFSCCKHTIEECRTEKDAWLKLKNSKNKA